MISVEDASIVLGMLARGDKQHDVAAYFGENPGRIIDVKFARLPRYQGIQPAPAHMLPVKAGGHPYMVTTQTSPAALLIHETMALVDQIETLKQLIETTPPDSPSVVLTLSVPLIQHILETYNLHNRKTRRGKIKIFAADMASGFWMVTGFPIVFGSNGELLDGQNRLQAGLQAGVSIKTHVVFGVDPVAFKYLDTGTVRTGGDTFTVAGVANPELAGKATRWLMIFEKNMDRGLVVPNADLFDHYTKRVNKAMLQRAIVNAKKVSKVIPTGSLAAMLYRFEQKDPDKAKIFAHDLEKGIRAGRTLLTRLKTLRRDNLGRINELTATAFTVLAWNYFRQTGHNSIRGVQLRWTDAEAHPDIE